MNMFVSSAALATATPVVAKSISGPSGLDHSAILARAEQVVKVLRDAFICDGWKLDEPAAEAMLAYFRSRAAGGPEDEAAEGVVIKFIVDHDQSFDWIMCGDPRGLICIAASNSKRAASISTAKAHEHDPTWTKIEAHENARAATAAAHDEVRRLEELLPREVRRGHAYVDYDEPEFPETDDPGWVAAEKNVIARFNREDELALALIEEAPTTIEGIAVLLGYAADHLNRGDSWPAGLVEDGEDRENARRRRPWEYYLLQNCANALMKFA